jgi:hypothetical protein
MALSFKEPDIEKLEKVLGTAARRQGASYRFEIGGKESGRQLALEIYPGISIGKEKGNLISVYTQSAHLQLHFCSGFVVSEMLGEVTFVGEQEGRLSGLIVEKEGGCSLYANVNRSLLSGDFTQLGPEVMLSGIALSLTDGILGDRESKPVRKRSGRPARKTGRTPAGKTRRATVRRRA